MIMTKGSRKGWLGRANGLASLEQCQVPRRGFSKYFPLMMMCRYNLAWWRECPGELEQPSNIWEGNILLKGQRGVEIPKLQHIFSPGFSAGLCLSHTSRVGPKVVVGSWLPCFLARASSLHPHILVAPP